MSTEPQSFSVTAAFDGMRLDRFLQARLPRMSRSSVQQAIASRVELASGRPPKPALRLPAGEVVTIHPRTAAGPTPAPPTVLESGPGWAVVDKPAGMPSVPHARHPGADAATLTGLAPAHRLDRFTSGCLLLCDAPALARHFEVAFRTGKVRKLYAAVVAGAVPAGEITVTAPLGPDPDSRVPGRMRVDEAGRPAVTRFESAASLQDGSRSLVLARPLTGRRHQVRVHLAHLGHPVVGDLLYGGDERAFIRFQLRQRVDVPEGVAPGRHLLHARRLAFGLPDGTTVGAEAPWPADFPADLVASLERGGSLRS